MRLRRYLDWRTLVIPLALALTATACGGDDGGAAEDGPTITVGSFNFPESVIIAEIYAQALEDAGYPVETELNLGAREFIYPDLESGAIDLLPEYAGSALQVQFQGEATADTEATVEALRSELEAIGVQALEPAPAQDKNVFVVTQQFADENGVTSVSDLADAGDLTLGGPPECEDRQTCYAGLQDVYGLDNLSFQSIQEGPIRISSLKNGEIDVSLLFSTEPTIEDEGFVALEDDQGLIAAENVVPVIRDEIVEAYGDDLTSLLNDLSAELTTEALISMNRQAGQGEDPAAIAEQWLTENGFLEE